MTSEVVDASVLVSPKTLETKQVELAAPESGQVQIHVTCTGICGSDLHYYNHFKNGDFSVKEPLVLGHESSGIVKRVGPNVKELKVGDRVAIEVGIPCLVCSLCLEGRYNLCPKLTFRSSAKIFPHVQGTLQELINHPARWCHKIGPKVSLTQAALVEPLSVAIHATYNRAPVRTGDRVLVMGAGAVGLLTAASARAAGAGQVIIADLVPARTAFALKNGFATHVYNVALPKLPKSPSPDNSEIGFEQAKLLSDRITMIASQDGSNHSAAATDDGSLQYDIAYDCTGVDLCVQASIYSVRPGGKVVFVGMGRPIQTLHLSAAMIREIDLIGVFRYVNCYPKALNMLEKGLLKNIDHIVTHSIIGLDKAQDAFQLASQPFDDEGKLVLKVFINSEKSD